MENFILSINCKDSEYEIALAKAVLRNSKGIIVKINDNSGDILLTDNLCDSNNEDQSVFLLTENQYIENGFDFIENKYLENGFACEDDFDCKDALLNKGLCGRFQTDIYTGNSKYGFSDEVLSRYRNSVNIEIAEPSPVDKNSGDDKQECVNLSESGTFEKADSLANDKLSILSGATSKGSAYKKIYKYGNVKNIIRRVTHEYALLRGIFISPIPSESTEVVTFFASSGGVGTTSIAISYAGEKSKYYGKRVLYLTLACFDTSKKFLSKGKCEYDRVKESDANSGTSFLCGEGKLGNSIRHFLYYLTRKKSFGYGSWDSFFTKDENGVSYFIMYEGLNPIVTLSSEEYERFMGCLIEKGNFDLIVIDAGSVPSEKLIRTIRLSDKSFEVIRFEEVCECHGIGNEADSDSVSNALRTKSGSERYFEDILGKNEYKKIPIIQNMFVYPEDIPVDEMDLATKKSNKAKNSESRILQKNKNKRDSEGIHILQEDIIKRCKININYDSDSFYYEDGIMKISPDKDFGMGIKELAKI